MLPILSILIWLPIAFAILSAVVPTGSNLVARVGGWLTFIASLFLFTVAPAALQATSVYHFTEHYAWFPDLGISLKLGVDGPAILLIVLTTFLTAFAIEASQKAIQTGIKGYFALFLFMEAALIGAFSSLDLLLFYLFFEAVLIPAYFLIGIWGGPKRAPAAMKFLLYTLVGSLLMLVGILALYLNAGHTFELSAILDSLKTHPLAPEIAAVSFGGFALAFAIKTPLFPFHSWLPDTYSEAPYPVTVLIAGAMGKLGTYGFYRFVLPLFPDLCQRAAPVFVWLAVIAIIYGALVAAVQRDVRRLIAYSSVSHLGFIVMGLFSGTPQGISGAVLQMINHGVSTGALFLIAGMLYERRGTDRIASFGGLWNQMPVFGRLFLIVTFSSIALPLTNGFVGEFLILLGTFQAYPIAAAVATTGVIWSAVYMLWMFQRVMYGPTERPENRRLTDVTAGEGFALGAFVVAIFLFGIAPALFTRYTDASVNSLIELESANAPAPQAAAAVRTPRAAQLAKIASAAEAPAAPKGLRD